MKNTNKENCNKSFPKEELTRVIQSIKNSAPGPDKIHDEMLEHIPPEWLDTILVLY